MDDFIEKIREHEALVAKICELQRRLDMTERLMGDCVIILADKNPKHRTVEYDEEDVLDIGKNLISLCYNVAQELQGKDGKQ